MATVETNEPLKRNKSPSLSFIRLFVCLSFLAAVATGKNLKLLSKKKSCKDSTRLQALDRSIKVLVLRHFETLKNQEMEDKKLLESYQTPEERYVSKQEYLDSFLTPTGKKKAIAFEKHLAEHYPNIKYVFLSPLNRAVQSAVLVTNGRRADIEYHVVPWLREEVSDCASLGWTAVQNLRRYPFIQGSERLSSSGVWFLDYWDYKNDKRDLGRKLEQGYAQNSSLSYILDFAVKHQLSESKAQVRARIKKAIKEVQLFIRNKQAQQIEVRDFEVLIVSHSRFLKAMGSKKSFGALHFPQPNSKMQNGELRTIELDV